MNRITRLGGLAAAGIAVAAAAGIAMNTANATPSPGPSTQGDGSYLVGGALKPGVYTAPNQYCYWSRYEAAASGKLVQVQQGQQPWVEIRKTDVMFTTSNCGDWTRSGDIGGLGSLGGLDFGSLGPVGSSDDAPKSPPPWTTPTTTPYPTGYQSTTTTPWTTPSWTTTAPPEPEACFGEPCTPDEIPAGTPAAP